MTDLSKFRTLAKNWEALGETDPLFGVLSDPTKFGGKWNADEFFASGRAHIEKLLRTLADVRASFEPGECLDFGCGVGRLTLPLSESFRHTLGVDVAKPMIESARRNAPLPSPCTTRTSATHSSRDLAPVHRRVRPRLPARRPGRVPSAGCPVD